MEDISHQNNRQPCLNCYTLYVLSVCILIGLLVRFVFWLVRVTPRLAMAGKENFCIDMKGDTPRVCVGYRQQSVPTAFERTRVMHGKSRISLHG